MMFDELTKNLICEHRKDTTRRLYNPNRRPAIPGTCHKIKIDRSQMTYGEICILKCKAHKFGTMTEFDAVHEGFGTLYDYKQYFYKVNGYIGDHDLVWAVQFWPIWVDINGVENKDINKKRPEWFKKQLQL